MRFLKENSGIIVKLYVNQIGIAIFSFFLYIIVAEIQPSDSQYSVLFKSLVSVLAVCFYLCLVYLAVWEIGGKDKIRIDAGKQEPNSLKGLLIGFYANVINFLAWGVSTLLIGLYISSGNKSLMSVFAVFNGIFRIFCSMYLGIVQGIANLFVGLKTDTYYLIESIAFTALPILSVAVVVFAYFMGVNNYRIIPQKNK